MVDVATATGGFHEWQIFLLRFRQVQSVKMRIIKEVPLNAPYFVIHLVPFDTRVEWNQMYHEVWRIQRDFFYDPHFHGLNLAEAEKKYLPFVKAAGGRGDINHLFDEMLGELTVGHMFIAGGDMPKATEVKGGLLGADYRVENGRYRFARNYNGENWNPEFRAPLTQPGVDVKVGDY